MLDRADTPWYPTMRLFRQPKPNDWTSVFREVRRELAAHSARAGEPAGMRDQQREGRSPAAVARWPADTPASALYSNVRLRPAQVPRPSPWTRSSAAWREVHPGPSCRKRAQAYQSCLRQQSACPSSPERAGVWMQLWQVEKQLGLGSSDTSRRQGQDWYLRRSASSENKREGTFVEIGGYDGWTGQQLRLLREGAGMDRPRGGGVAAAGAGASATRAAPRSSTLRCWTGREPPSSWT